MEQLILNTKIEIPLLRDNIIKRERLCALISESVDQQVILISAAAGFGKTTLLCQWANREENKVVWFSIDENDNDESCFFTYFIRTLQQLNPMIGDTSLNLLQTPQPPQFESVIIILLNEIHKLEDNITLILDDYHHISSARINQLINFLIDHLPKNMRIIISSRSDPNLPIARWLSQDKLIEIRAADLAFNNDESDLLFNKMLELELSTQDIERLKTRTEGWVTGLQLAAVSLRGHEDRGEFIKQFHGNNRYVVDYLLEEVFNQHADDVQTFLLYTSILNQLNDSLCDIVLDSKNSRELLESLEKQNMFIIPIDPARDWYRYHQLFKDVLSQKLLQLPGIKTKLLDLNQKAGQWFEDHGIIDEAIDHYLEANNYKNAAILMERTAENKWLCGQQKKLLSWFEHLPREYISQHPHLGIFFARELEMNGRGDEAEEVLNQTEENLLKLEDRSTITASGLQLSIDELRGRILVIRCVMSSFRGNFTGVILYAGEALELLNTEDFRWRNIAEITYGLANSWAGFGNFSIARQAFHQAQHSSEKIKDTYLYIFCGICIAAAEWLQGECYKSIETYTELLTVAERKGLGNTGLVGSIYAALGSLYCEINELEKGATFLKQGTELAEKGHDALMLASARLNQVRLYFYVGNSSKITKIINDMESSPQASFYPPWMQHVLSAIRPWTWMKMGKLKEAKAWAENLGFPSQDDMSMRREVEYVVLARILIAQKKTEDASKLLAFLMIDAQKGNRLLRIAELCILKSINYYFQDEIDKAVVELYSALKFGEPRGLFRVFVYEGEPIAELADVILDVKSDKKNDPYEDVSENYLKKLVRTIREEEIKPGSKQIEEPLSEREQEVLEYIAEGLSNNQIAEKLFVSLNTVRTHTKKINSKLGVHSRTQAVAKAKNLGLIE
jgi:LuxR family maltose regulon positive regulatory protein